MALYHQGSRTFQDEFSSRRIADRLEEKLARTVFTEDDRAFIEGCLYFFLATADAEGRPDCSFKGGTPGFVRVTGPSEIAFPDYDGNGMFKSLGNVAVNANVGLLFIAMHDKPRRLRVNGTAVVHRDDPLLSSTVGAQLIVRVTARVIFPNCPRYIPNMQLVDPSIYAPRPDHTPRTRLESSSRLQGLRPPAPPNSGLRAHRAGRAANAATTPRTGLSRLRSQRGWRPSAAKEAAEAYDCTPHKADAGCARGSAHDGASVFF